MTSIEISNLLNCELIILLIDSCSKEDEILFNLTIKEIEKRLNSAEIKQYKNNEYEFTD